MSSGWMSFTGKGDPGCKISVKCHCGEKTKPQSNPAVGTEFCCPEHKVVAFMRIKK